MTRLTLWSFALLTLTLAGCPSPSSRHVFFGVSKRPPLDPEKATRLYETGLEHWKQREKPAELAAAIASWGE